MSVTTNIVTKFKQLFYNAGTTPDLVDSAIDAMDDIIVAIKVPSGNDGNAASAAVNSAMSFALPVDTKLIGAKMSTTNAIDNAAADTINLNVAVNGIVAVAFDSDALAATLAANTVTNLTVNTVNSFLDAGEVCIVSYLQQVAANNYLDGIVTLQFRRQ